MEDKERIIIRIISYSAEGLKPQTAISHRFGFRGSIDRDHNFEAPFETTPQLLSSCGVEASGETDAEAAILRQPLAVRLRVKRQ